MEDRVNAWVRGDGNGNTRSRWGVVRGAEERVNGHLCNTYVYLMALHVTIPACSVTNTLQPCIGQFSLNRLTKAAL
jgi:hypothetical protein